jgi:hypothetical protein
MRWYRLDLLDGFTEHIDQAWQTAWDAAFADEKPDPGNAIFRKERPGGGSVLYFTPAAQLLAESFGAKPCKAPSRGAIGLVAGDERAWDIHFAAPDSPASGFWPTQPGDKFEPTHPFPVG